MMSKQTLSEDLFFDPSFTDLSDDTTRLILIGLILHADKNNGGNANARVLARKLDEPEYFIESALQEMSKKGLIHLQEAQGHRYYQVCNWRKYVPRPRPTASSTSPTATPKTPKAPNGTSATNAAASAKKRDEKREHDHSLDHDAHPGAAHNPHDPHDLRDGSEVAGHAGS